MLCGKVSQRTVSRRIKDLKDNGKTASKNHRVDLGQESHKLTNPQKKRKIPLMKEASLYCVSKFPLSVMVWIGLTENGPTQPYFLDKNETINSTFYQRRILPFAKREGQRIFVTKQWESSECQLNTLKMEVIVLQKGIRTFHCNTNHSNMFHRKKNHSKQGEIIHSK
ncbi:hypothetical protein BpHYR1_049882, partial [Brachionus plicatilis]